MKKYKYDYLKQFLNQDTSRLTFPYNWFNNINDLQEKINKISRECNLLIPKPLQLFWNEIGTGSLCLSKNGIEGGDNYFYTPELIFDVLIDPKKQSNGHDLVLYDQDENLIKNGYFPFFGISDHSSFLWMKAGSDSVYNELEEVVEEHIEDFMYKLYHVHPQYYLFTEEELKDELTKAK